MTQKSTEELRRQIAELEGKLSKEHTVHEDIRADLARRTSELTERLKELNCLLQISRLSERSSLTFKDYILEALRIIIASFEKPECISAELTLGIDAFRTHNFSTSRWKLGRGLMDQDIMIGYLNIFYSEKDNTANEDPFKKEEKNFIIVITRYLVQIIKSKQYEGELKRFREIVAQSPNMIIVTDDMWNVEFINEQVTKTLGYRLQELEGKTASLIPLYGVSVSLDSLGKQLIHKKSLKGETRIIKKDGSLLWVRGSVSAIENLDRKKSYVAIFEDISKEVEMKEKYTEEHEKYRKVMDNIPVSITLCDDKGHFLFANKQAEKNLNIGADILYQKCLTDIFPDEGKKPLETIQAIFSDKLPRKSEVLYTLGGNKTWFEINRIPVFDSEERVIAVMSIAENISHRKKTEKLLNVQRNIESVESISENLEESMGIIFDSLFELDWIDGAGLYLIDYEREILALVYHRGLSQEFARKVARYSFDTPNAKAVFSKASWFVRPDEFTLPTRSALEKENIIFNCVLPLIHKDRVIGSLNLGSRMVEDLGEFDRLAIQSIAARVANIIQLVRTQEDLKRTNESLSKALKSLQENRQMLIQKSRLESLGELSAGLAHEINQPLSVISLSMENLELRLSHGRYDEKYIAGKIFSINQNIQKIRQLIDHVRIFSRDQKEILFERVDINQTIHNALALIHEQLRHRRISVTLELEEKTGYVLGNTSRLEQVFLNLIANSRDALDEKEKSSNEPGIAKKIRISTQKLDDTIEIVFWDNGTGISKQNIQRVFDPFFSTKPPGLGTGLGLPIAYGIIREMKGEIFAKSTVGKFTRITILLPFIKSRERKT